MTRLRSLLRGIVTSPLHTPQAHSPAARSWRRKASRRCESGSMPPFASQRVLAGAGPEEVWRGSTPGSACAEDPFAVKRGRGFVGREGDRRDADLRGSVDGTRINADVFT